MIKKFMDSDELRSLCIRKNWFTCGSIRQYDMLFIQNELGAPIEEIATIIWICSVASKKDVYETLQKAHEEYLKRCDEE